MKNSNFIADSVFKVKLNYEKMQNETEDLFFRCLEEERDVEYFTEKIKKIWGDVDHSFMENEIQRYRETIHKEITGKEEVLTKNSNELFALVPILALIKVEDKFKNIKQKEYKRSIKYIKGLDSKYKSEQKKEYIKLTLGKYTNKTVVYRPHTDGGHIRLVPPSVYNSMIYNTNLTREGWNQTMEDAEKVKATHFIIPYHSFSCPHCLHYQEKLLTRDEIIEISGRANEAKGDILHPNCKCEIAIWKPFEPIPKSKLTETQKEEASVIRQKVNGLTLEKERLKTKMKIAKRNNEMGEFDKYNQKRNKINKSIRELKEQLPTEELRKQVVAINR